MKHLLAVTAVFVYLPAVAVCLPATAWAQPHEEAPPKEEDFSQKDEAAKEITEDSHAAQQDEPDKEIAGEEEPKAEGGKPADSKAVGSKPAAPKAEGGEPAEPDWQTAPAARRSGFLAGIALGPSFGGASGYPNDAIKIDREAYFTNTGVGFGGSVEAWVGGALADWFSFGLGGGIGRMITADHRTDFISGILRLEVFPLFSLGEQWREVGLLVAGGVGFTETNPLDGDTELIFSGGASRLGLGVFWEGIRLWQISMGPFASADFIWSPSALRPMGWIGWRTALYTGP